MGLVVGCGVVVATVVFQVMDGGVVGRGVVVATVVGIVLGEGVYGQTACHMYSILNPLHRGPRVGVSY